MAKSNTDFDFTSDLAAIRQDLTKLTERISGIAQHQADNLGQSMSEGVSEAKAAISSMSDDARSSAQKVSHDAQAAIEHNPLTTALIVFGIGVSLGLMSRPRS